MLNASSPQAQAMITERLAEDKARVMRRRNDATQRIWSAIRIIRTNLDAGAVAMTARTAETTAIDYIRILVRGGYLAISRDANGKTGQRNVYRLMRDTGPTAPRRCMDFIIDGNSGDVVALRAHSRPVWRRPRTASAMPEVA